MEDQLTAQQHMDVIRYNASQVLQKYQILPDSIVMPEYVYRLICRHYGCNALISLYSMKVMIVKDNG